MWEWGQTNSITLPWMVIVNIPHKNCVLGDCLVFGLPHHGHNMRTENSMGMGVPINSTQWWHLAFFKLLITGIGSGFAGSYWQFWGLLRSPKLVDFISHLLIEPPRPYSSWIHLIFWGHLSSKLPMPLAIAPRNWDNGNRITPTNKYRKHKIHKHDINHKSHTYYTYTHSIYNSYTYTIWSRIIPTLHPP